MTATLEVGGVDLSCHALFPITVSRGRDHPAESFAAAQLTVSLDGVHALARGQWAYLTMPAPLSNLRWETAVGTWAQASGTWLDNRTSLEVFAGRLTDVRTVWDPLAPQKWRTTTRILAVDPVGELVNVPVGDVPWPSESGTDRAARITAAVGNLTWSIDPAPAILAARDVDSRPALELLDQLTQSVSATGGVWFDPNTHTAHVMSDASRPRDTVPSVTLKACDLMPDTEWLESVGDVVNDCTVIYTPAADTRAEARSSLVLEGDSAGRRSESISTELVSAAVATQRATDQTSRYGRPAPRLGRVTLTSRSVTSRAAAERILKAVPTDLVEVLELPPPAPDTWQGFTEGWELTLTGPDDWTLAVDLSPAIWSGLFLMWSEIGRPDYLSDSSWLKAPGWLWFGYGYGYPGGKIQSVHAGLAITWGAPPQQPTDQAQQFAGRYVTVEPGHTYVIAAEGTFQPGTAGRCRVTFGYITSSAWSATPASGNPIVLDHTWTAPPGTTVVTVGLESEPGVPQTGGVTLTRFTMTDITDAAHGYTWADLDPAGRWFDATADLTWS